MTKCLAQIILVAAVCLCATPAVSAPKIGSPAPVFDAPITLLSGAKLDPATLKGKVVLLDMWATWCAPCKEALPIYQRFYTALRAQGFEVVAISIDERADELRSFVKASGLTFPIGWDPKSAWPARIELRAMPTALLIGRGGKVRYVHEGFHDGDGKKLEAQIKALIAEPTP